VLQQTGTGTGMNFGGFQPNTTASMTITKQNSLTNQKPMLQTPSYGKNGGNTTVSTLVSSGMLSLADPMKFKNLKPSIESSSVNERDSYGESYGGETEKSTSVVMNTPKTYGLSENPISRSYTYSYSTAGDKNAMESGLREVDRVGSKERRVSGDNMEGSTSNNHEIEEGLLNEGESEEDQGQNNE